jgi:acetyltransferase-like isoleucine patch superfamily enzyme
MRSLTLLLDYHFYVFVLRKLLTSARALMDDYRRDNFSSDTDERTRLLLRKGLSISGAASVKVGEGVNLHPDVEIVGPESASDGASVILGRNSRIGERTQLGVYAGNTLHIGDYVRVGHNCAILGDVRIENYSVLSWNIFISSGDHNAKLFPNWLINDQDAWAANNLECMSKPVHIEEDCWIGWGAFIKRGIYIGRGAVIGAYTVVTKDVPPYSIQGGIPNKEISKRLEFKPPMTLQALEEDHWPYFYAGFLLRRQEIEVSKRSGVLFAGANVRFVLGGGRFDRLIFKGRLKAEVERISLRVLCNRVLVGIVAVTSAEFTAEIGIPDDIWGQMSDSTLPSVLRSYNEVALQIIDDEVGWTGAPSTNGGIYYGVESVSLRMSQPAPG